jgi:extracellular elastinolytic metalloproteinase
MFHPRRRAVAAVALAVSAAAFPAAAGAATPPPSAVRSGAKPFFDVRSAASAPAAKSPRALPAADRSARTRLVRRLGRQAVLDADPVTATPRVLGRTDGTLTGGQSGDAAAVAMSYVRANAPALGLTVSDLAAMRLGDRSTTGGVTHLRWRQEFRGIPAFDNELRVNVDGDGRVVNVLGSPRHDLSVASVTPRLSAADALAALARNVGVPARAGVTAGPSGARAETRFSSGDRARLVLFGDVGAVRLAWHLTYDAAPGAWYDAVVDATTGRVLRRANLVKAIDGLVFDNYPGAPGDDPQRVQSLDDYLTDTTRLFGDFAHAWSDINDASPDPLVEAPDPNEEVQPAQYAFRDFTPDVVDAGGCLPTALCSWDHRAPDSWQSNRRQNAVQAFYYVNHYHDHLARAPIGFTAASDNFEGADRVLVESDDGADTADGLPDGNHIDNANMSTPPEGQSPIMQMFLFEHVDGSPFRDVNGGDDASVVYHEYTHGLSNRLIVDADGDGALNTAQAGAMGEAWSDWYAKDFLNDEGFQADTAAPGEVDMGTYVDDPPHQIRTQALDCPVDADPIACPGTDGGGTGGYTYGDFGRILGSPEVHADGEIWGETLWDLRVALGSDVTEAIITEGMRLSPPEPSYLDARNAIIQADQALFGGVHVNSANGIWATFAHRGMGFFAGATDGNDTSPVEDTHLPPAPGTPMGAIAGRVTDAVTGLPLAGRPVGIGGLDTPPSAFAATTDADGRYAIAGVPVGVYPAVTTHAFGYDTPKLRVAVQAGTTQAVDIAMRRDWAGLAGGASIVTTNDDVFADFGCGVAQAFDQATGVGWSAFSADSASPGNTHPGVAPTVTVALPEAVDVSAFGIDPSNNCGDDSSSATKDIRVEVSSDGTTFTPALTHTFVPGDVGAMHDIAPTGGASGVRFVRVTLLTPMDPAGPSGSRFVDLSEFEVLGARPGNVAPSGPLVASPGTAATGQTVTLDASQIRDPDSAIAGYSWDVDGNGTFDQRTSAPVLRTSYGFAGTFQPRVGATDFLGGGTFVASSTVTVVAPAAPGAPGGAQPGSGPAPAQVFLRPTAGIVASRTRGRATFTIGCALACRATATMTVSRATARRLHLGRRTLATVTRRLTVAGRRTFALNVSAATLRRIRARGVRTVTATVSVTIRDTRNQTRTLRRTVRIRIR